MAILDLFCLISISKDREHPQISLKHGAYLEHYSIGQGADSEIKEACYWRTLLLGNMNSPRRTDEGY